MRSSSIPFRTLFHRVLTLCMVACFVTAGLVLVKPVIGPARVLASTNSASPWTTKSIEDIQVGDLVLARDEHGSAIAWKPVKAIYRRTSHHLRHLTFLDPAGHAQLLETTDEHPFWSESDKRFVKAGDLKVGNRVVSAPDPGTGAAPTALNVSDLQTLASTAGSSILMGLRYSTFRSMNIIDLTIAGEPRPIGATANHPSSMAGLHAGDFMLNL